jgi:hypothetical protein
LTGLNNRKSNPMDDFEVKISNAFKNLDGFKKPSCMHSVLPLLSWPTDRDEGIAISCI